MTRLHLVRHGPTHATVMLGWTDRPADLSDHAAVARLDAELPRGAMILSSDLIRASATADALSAGRRRLPHDPRLREINFGAWERQSFAQIEAATPRRIEAFWQQAGSVRAPGGESWNELHARVSAAIGDLLSAHQGQEIVVVSHFGPILVGLQLALGLDIQQAFAHRIEPLSLTTLTCGTDGWRAERIAHRA